MVENAVHENFCKFRRYLEFFEICPEGFRGWDLGFLWSLPRRLSGLEFEASPSLLSTLAAHPANFAACSRPS